MNLPWISLLTFTPLVGGLIVFGVRDSNRRVAKNLAFGLSLVALGLALGICAKFDPASGALQFQEHGAWVPKLGVEYFVGVDGLSLLMVLLTALLVPMAMLAAWRMADRAEFYFGLILLLQAGLFGTFTALNFFHWFISGN